MSETRKIHDPFVGKTVAINNERDALSQENARLRTYVGQLEAALKHATECCVAFQSGGQFNHLMRPGEPVFNGVPRLVAKLSN